MYDGYRPLDPPAWWVRLFDRRRPTTDNTGDALAVGGTEAERADAAAAAARPELPLGPEVPVG